MKKAIIVILVIAVLVIPVLAFAHSGRTDSAGGHTDRDTGEYHYHHGHSAHQHTNGECPYDFDDRADRSSSNYSSNKTYNSPKITNDLPKNTKSPPSQSPQPKNKNLVSAEKNTSARDVVLLICYVILGPIPFVPLLVLLYEAIFKTEVCNSKIPLILYILGALTILLISIF